MRIALAAASELPADPRELLAEVERPILEQRRARALGEEATRDFLVGRLAAKRAVGALLGEAAALAQIALVPDEEGAPRVRVGGGEDREDLAVSVTHRRGLAAAVAARREAGLVAVGIDIETRDDARTRGIERFALRADEDALIAASPAAADRTEALLALFCIKEAAMKTLRAGVFDGMRDVDARAAWQRGGAASPPARESLIALALEGRAAERARAAGVSAIHAAWWRWSHAPAIAAVAIATT